MAIGYCQEKYLVKRTEEAIKAFFIKNPHLTDEIANVHIKELVISEQIKTINNMLKKMEEKNENDLALLLQNQIKEIELIKYKMTIGSNELE